MLLMRACACGLRTIAACSMPCTLRSSVYLPRPVMSDASSRRLIEEPMIPGMDRLLGAGDGPNGLDDVVVAGAAAEVALEPFADLLLRGMRIARQETHRGEDHPRR